MGLLSQPIGASHLMVVGAVMFVAGVVCMATKRNAPELSARSRA